jgi:hypothetical protein
MPTDSSMVVEQAIAMLEVTPKADLLLRTGAVTIDRRDVYKAARWKPLDLLDNPIFWRFWFRM